MAQPMILVYNVTTWSNLTITLPLHGTVNVRVDWDDTQTNLYTLENNYDHIYGTAGTYTVQINGTCKEET
jgi:hypothetical protein